MTEELVQGVNNEVTVRPDTLGRVLFVLAALALALAPTQLLLDLKKGPPLHPAEPVLLLALLVWGIRFLIKRNTSDLPPLAHWLLVLAAGVGVFITQEAGARSGVIKETAQMILYLLLAYPIFRTAFSTPARLRTAVIGLLITTTLATLLGAEQRWALQYGATPDRNQVQHLGRFTPIGGQVDPKKRVVFEHPSLQVYLSAQQPHYVCSTFSSWSEHGYHPSRATYAGFLALVLPFMLVLLVSERRRVGMAIWGSVLFAAAAVSVLAGFVLPAVLAGLLVTGFALGWRVGRWTLVGVLVYLLAVSLCGGINRQEILREPLDLRVSAQEAHYRYAGGVRHLKKFWGEQQAALNILRSSPLFGTGAGGYQQMVTGSYDRLGSIDEQRSEPGLQNGYLIIAASMGLLGLAAMLLLYSRYWGLAWRAVREGMASPWSAALLGAITALILLTLATNPWVRGTSVVIAAWLASIGNCATQSPVQRINTQEGMTCE